MVVEVTGTIVVLVTTVVSVSVVVIAWALPNWTSVLNATKHTVTNSRPRSILVRFSNSHSLL